MQSELLPLDSLPENVRETVKLQHPSALIGETSPRKLALDGMYADPSSVAITEHHSDSEDMQDMSIAPLQENRPVSIQQHSEIAVEQQAVTTAGI